MKERTHTIWNKQLPALFSVVLVAISLVTISWLSGNIILFGSKAAAGNTPKNVQISNITDSSFTVSYITDEKVLGTLTYGKNKELGGVALDDRDQLLGKPIPHRVHHITIQRINPSTTYYLSIVSGDGTFMNNKDFYHITTAPPALDKPTSQPPLAGKVTLDDGSIPTESIVYVKTNTSQLLSTLLKPDGSYLIPLNSMREIDFSSYVAFSPDTKLSVQIVSPTLQSSLSTLAGQANPVPLIVLSKNYDFSLEDTFSAFSASDSASASNSGSLNNPGLPQPQDTTIVTSPQILIPIQNQAFDDQQPRFSGKAIPNAAVDIDINADTDIKTTIQSDSYGNWSFRPPTSLMPGNHTITINSLDATGVMQKVSQSFVVHGAGSQFIEPSVPVTPTNTPAPTLEPTTQPTIQPTAVATEIPTPTGNGNGNGNGTGGGSGTGGNGSGTGGGSNSLTPGNGQNGPTSPPIPRTGNEGATIGIFASIVSIIIGGILFTLL